jgi:hypothetical protein
MRTLFERQGRRDLLDGQSCYQQSFRINESLLVQPGLWCLAIGEAKLMLQGTRGNVEQLR